MTNPLTVAHLEAVLDEHRHHDQRCQPLSDWTDSICLPFRLAETALDALKRADEAEKELQAIRQADLDFPAVVELLAEVEEARQRERKPMTGPSPVAGIAAQRAPDLCHAFDPGTVGSDGKPIGDCTLPRGHDTGWHDQRDANGRVLAQWRGPHNGDQPTLKPVVVTEPIPEWPQRVATNAEGEVLYVDPPPDPFRPGLYCGNCHRRVAHRWEHRPASEWTCLPYSGADT